VKGVISVNITQNQFYQYLLDLILLIVAGLGQYLHLVPVGTDIFYPLLFVVIGHVVGTVPTISPSSALQANTLATQANTQATISTQTTSMPTVASTLPGGKNG
jgi:hypothetical protein